MGGAGLGVLPAEGKGGKHGPLHGMTLLARPGQSHPEELTVDADRCE